MSLNSPQLELHAADCWECVTGLLSRQISQADVKEITDKDFNGGELVLNPPSIRVMYANTSYKSLESQGVVYETQHNFLAICGDQDLRGSRDQSLASLGLAQSALAVLGGGRLRLRTGETTEPIILVGVEPMDVADFGVAYAAAFQVPGPAVFPAPNAHPSSPGENNG